MDTEASVWQSNVTRIEPSFALYGEVHVSMSVPAKSQRCSPREGSNLPRVLTFDQARRIADNVAKLPGLLAEGGNPNDT
jgi:hypothetical protein